MKKIVVLSGAGISAESGIKTFRDSDGLWENYRIEDVATPEAWRRDQALVLDFYNQRRKQALTAEPNAAHHILAELEKDFEVQIITQNVDNLHERAGSTHVLHLHGELFKARSTKNPALIYELGDWALNVGDQCELGSQLRPHIVWFGEEVPAIQEAIPYCEEADVFIVVGTSLQVYPAAGLVDFVRPNTPVYVVDPNLPSVSRRKNVTYIAEKASLGLQMIQNQLQA
ncbi:SIR2 family NAD-dependent protein deacylase [Siphonobacter curvatus]|uniref:NAD-dependent protein deacylase n=1 Tax=Siphonobacter curvatus TaxID=2094562 RepID=A0A2S7IQC1_9BACT|nr:NAD-dependent deacylase [Siphonobacter curvatus]PQA59914.1 NAD-dependent protein deacylase [Siphonobacter curvatus]